MPGQNLSDVKVQFSVAGAEAMKAAMNDVQKQLAAISAGVNTVGPLMTNVLGVARSHLEGFARAGIANTTVGWVWSFQLERISRQIAGLFMPAIRQAVEYTRQMADWLQKLTGKQQENIGRWIAAGAAALTVAVVLPKVIAGVEALILSVRGLTVAFATLDISSGIGAILPIVAGLATAIAALAVGSEVGRQGLGGLWDAVKPMIDGLGELVGQFYQTVEPITAQLAGVFETVLTALGKMVPFISQAVQSLSQGVMKGFAGLVSGAQAVAQAFALIWQVSGPLMPRLGAAVGGIIHTLGVLGGHLTAIWAQAITLIQRAVARILPKVMEIVDALTEALAPALEVVAELFMAAFSGLETFFLDIADVLITIIHSVLVPALKGLAGILREISKLVAGILGTKLDFDVKVRAEKPLTQEGHEEPQRLPSGFEAIDQTWRRIAEASVKSTLGKDPKKQAVELLDQIEKNTSGTKTAVGQIKPGIV